MSLIVLVMIFLVQVNLINCHNDKLTELIRRIHNETNSATLVFFDCADIFLDNFLRQEFNIPVAILGPSLKEHAEYNWDAVLVVKATPSNNCESLHHMIPLLRVRKFVVAISENFESLRKCMFYLWKKKFPRIFGISRGFIYAFLPFEKDPIRSLSKIETLPDSLGDLNGYMFRTIISPDLPRVFWFRDAHGNRLIRGYVGQLFMSFLKRHNATFKEIDVKDVESRFMLAVEEATKNNQIDVSMNAYKPVEGLASSYPFSMMTWNIIAPKNGHLDPNQYFLHPFKPAVWLSIGVTLFYLFVMNILKDYLTDQPIENIWHYFSEIYLAMLNYATERDIKRYFLFYCQVFVLAFIIGNLYTVLLTSYLTVYIQIKQFHTIQDLIDNNFPVMMVDYEWNVIEDPELHPKNFEKIVTLVGKGVMFRERNKMVNTSFAYAMGGDKALFYMGFQKRFASKSLFRMIEDNLGSYYLGFLLAEHSPFIEILNEFIMDVLETGLLDKWLNDAVSEVRANGLLKIGTVFPDRKVPYPLTVYHLRFAWICLASGLSASTVIFSVEKFIEYFNLKHKLKKLF